MNDHRKLTQNQPKPAMPIGPGGPGRAGMGLVQKPKDFSSTMKKLVSYLKPFWVSVIFVFVFAIASTVFAIVSPKILGHMTNQIVNDYIDMKAYDQVTANLPTTVKIPRGTTGAQLLQSAPPAMLQQIPTNLLDRIKKLDLSVRPQIDFDKLKLFMLELLLLYLLSALLSYVQGWIMTGVSQKVTYQFRRDISEKINRLPLAYFDKKTFGEVLSRVTNDVDTVSQTLNQSLTQLVTSITMIIGILVMMFSISWQMTLVSLVLVPISFVLISLIIKKSQHYFKEQQNSLGELNGHVEEMYSGHNVMKVFNGEQRSIQKFKKINGKLYGSAWMSQFLSGLMFPIMTFVGNLGFVGVSVLGGWLVIKGQIQIGDIQAFIQYVSQFNQPIIQTANVANVLQSTAAAAERVFEFLGETEETADTEILIVESGDTIHDVANFAGVKWQTIAELNRLSAPYQLTEGLELIAPTSASSLTLANVKGEVEFQDVVFGYDKDKTIIKDFSAHIKSGQKIAIVGPTGAGKTTIVNLLMRFYDINLGTIKIDGIDIHAMKRSAVRKLFSMVLQDTWLFNGTIKENIAYGKPNASDAEIATAAKAAHADHFIHALPQGYNLQLNEEADNISQGEKQLLTIARAMLANHPILILDEATSSVDTRTEILIQKAMENLMKNRTSFVIAHRLSTIRDANLILVMNHGNIVEQGTHAKLLAKNGFYASLYNNQFVVSSDQ